MKISDEELKRLGITPISDFKAISSDPTAASPHMQRKLRKQIKSADLAQQMLLDHQPIVRICRYTRLPEEIILYIQNQLNNK